MRVETDYGLVGVGSGDTMNGFDDFVSVVRGPRPARHRAPCTGARDGLFSRGPLLAARGRAVGPVRTGLRPAGGLAAGGRAHRSCRRTRRGVRFELRVSGPRTPWRWSRRASGRSRSGSRRGRADEGIGVVAAVRDAVGDGLEIMVDLNQWWRMAGDIGPRLDVAGARRIVERLRALRRAVGRGAAAGRGPRRDAGSAGGGRGADRRRRDGADVRGAAPRAGFRCLGRVSARRGAGAGHLGRADAGRAGAAAEPVVHAPHVDQRDRRARQPARVRGGRRRAVPRVPVRPAGMDAGAARLHARIAGDGRSRTDCSVSRTRLGWASALDEEAVAFYAVDREAVRA